MAKFKTLDEVNYLSDNYITCIFTLSYEEKIKIFSKDYCIDRLKAVFRNDKIEFIFLTKMNEEIKGDLRFKNSTLKEMIKLMKTKEIDN